MPGLLTPASTGDAPAPARPATPVPTVGTNAPLTTTSMNSPLAGMTGAGPSAGPPIHNNEAVNAALMNAFRPIVPDQVNSLLGPAIGQIQGHTLPISYVQPRQAAPVSAVRRSS